MDDNSRPQGIEAFSEVKCAVVVCAHADDMETQIGGTISMLAERGVEVYEVICTLGDIGSNDEQYTRDSLSAIRREEAREGGRLLGLREVVTLNYHDGELEPSLDLRAEIAGYYRAWQPDTLFTFDPSWSGQIHADHRAAGRVAIDALMPSRQRLYHPEQLATAGAGKVSRVYLFNPEKADMYVDVTDVYDTKLAASLAHRSQFPEGEKNLEWMRELDKRWANAWDLGDRYAEQFSTLRLW